MELLIQVYELATRMPPLVSALLSLTTLVVIYKLGKPTYKLGKKILDELGQHSEKLGSIEIQTIKTNGRVTALEKAYEVHFDQDDRRHTENQNALKVVVDNQDEMLEKITKIEKRKGIIVSNG